jgi:7,8-dihydropterin-6-yl-methyl-4-(beta-D-ribofuranosyl)aminobenzene 5'-phosphate synthase
MKTIIKIFFVFLIISSFIIFSCNKTDSKIPNEIPLNQNTKMDSNKLSIQILYDDIGYDTAITPAYGFSCFIHFENENILFDTGTDGKILLENMNKCGISPDSVEIVVISHNHYDHLGGLMDFFNENPEVKIYMSKEVFPNAGANAINQIKSTVNLVKNQIVPVSDINNIYKISDNIYSTGFFGSGIPEQSLILDTEKGIIIITGCAHQGIVNVVRRAKDYFNKPIFSLFGGFHLGSKSKIEIENIIKELKDLGVINCTPMHCTGQQSSEMIKSDFGNTLY